MSEKPYFDFSLVTEAQDRDDMSQRLHELVDNDGNRPIYNAVARNRNATTETLEKIYYSTINYEVLEGVASHPNTCLLTLMLLMKHTDVRVAQRAGTNWE